MANINKRKTNEDLWRKINQTLNLDIKLLWKMNKREERDMNVYKTRLGRMIVIRDEVCRDGINMLKNWLKTNCEIDISAVGAGVRREGYTYMGEDDIRKEEMRRIKGLQGWEKHRWSVWGRWWRLEATLLSSDCGRSDWKRGKVTGLVTGRRSWLFRYIKGKESENECKNYIII